MRPPLHYTGGVLDRSDRLRQDEGWLAERRRDPRSRFLPVWQDRNLVMLGDTPTAAAVAGDRLPDTADPDDGLVFLGIGDGETAWFGIDLSELPRDALSDLCDGAKLVTLRRVGPVMPRADGAVLAYARGMMHWHRCHRYCGVCGAPTASSNGGHLRICRDGNCGAEHFPRTDPAVIMLVTHRADSGDASGDSCLLARQARWPQGMMSTLAGFVEPGETLEEAVAREVLEETGVRVVDVRYQGSQPWPFPSSLMLGFRAEAVDKSAPVVNPDELDDARWFTRADVADAEARGLRLPGEDSIARRLILDWLGEH